MKRGIIILLIALSAVGLIALKLETNQAAQAREVKSELDQLPGRVQAAPVRYREVSEAVSAAGTVEAGQAVLLQSEADGKVQRVYFAAGDRVKPGQLLAETDATPKRIQHQLDALTHRKALRDYERLRALHQAHNATTVEVENAQLQLETAEAQLRASRRQRDLGRILAPIGGVVTEKKITPGEYLQPGTPVATLVDMDRLVVKVNLPAREAVRLRKGDPVTVRADVYPDHTFPGVVKTVIPQATQARTYPVEIAVDNPGAHPLFAGMEVQVVINEGKSHAVLALPRTALTGDYATPAVLLIQGKQAVARPIRIGRQHGTWLEVTGGLRPGDLVVVAGQQHLAPGAPIPAYALAKP
jgi:RND family efflux transporter MFP subunit